MTPISVWLPMRVRGIALASGVVILLILAFLAFVYVIDFLGLL